MIWIGTHAIYGRSTEWAEELLLRDHADSDKLGPVLAFYWNTPGSKATEALLRHEAEKSPHREIRGLATYWLPYWLNNQAGWVRGIKARSLDKHLHPADVIVEAWGRDFDDRLRALDPAALRREATALLERVIKDYGDVPFMDWSRREDTLGHSAKAVLEKMKEEAKVLGY